MLYIVIEWMERNVKQSNGVARLDELNVLLLTYFTLLVTLIYWEIRMKSNNKENKKVNQRGIAINGEKTNDDRGGNTVNKGK